MERQLDTIANLEFLAYINLTALHVLLLSMAKLPVNSHLQVLRFGWPENATWQGCRCRKRGAAWCLHGGARMSTPRHVGA